jgi:hypothetical protein
MALSRGKRFVAVSGAIFGMAGLLGASLGLAVAGNKGTLPTGPSYIGGPLENMTPAKYTSCLPAQNWNSIYIWDAANQQWLHWVNPAKGVPSYVNSPTVGGIETIPRFAGLAILVDSTITDAYFPDTNNQNCPG